MPSLSIPYRVCAAAALCSLCSAGCQHILGIDDISAPNPTGDASPASDNGVDAAPDVPPPSIPPPMGFLFRRPLTISAGSAAVPAGYTVSLTVDTKALADRGAIRTDGRDFRIYRAANGRLTEIPRWVEEVSEPLAESSNLATWFRLIDGIPATGSDTTYYLYYGNSELVEPAPQDLNDIFVFGDDFEDDLALWRVNGHGENVSIEGGAIAEPSLGVLRIEPGLIQKGGIHVDMDLPHETLLFSHWIHRAGQSASLGHLQTYDVPWEIRDNEGWTTGHARSWNELDVDNSLILIEGGNMFHQWERNLSTSYWYRVEFVHDTRESTIKSRRGFNQPWNPTYGDYNGNGQQIRSFSILGEGQGGIFHVDNYIIRRYIEPEPTVLVHDEEQRGIDWDP